MRKSAALLLATITLLLLLAAYVAPHPYATQFRETTNAAASRQFLLGTDALGRDRFSRMLYGGRISLLCAPAAALVSSAMALLIALLAGCLGRRAERLAGVAADVCLSLPWLFALLAVRAVLPLNAAPWAGVLATFGLLGLLGWAGPARVILAAVKRQLGSDFILFARAGGTSAWRVATVHLLPNLLPLACAQFLVTVPAFLLAEANLGLLGLGIPEPIPSLGGLLRELENLPGAVAHPWMFVPALLLFAVVSSFHLLVSADKYSVEMPRVGQASRPVIPVCFAQTGQEACPLCVLSLILLALLCTQSLAAQWGGELRFCIRSEPRSLHPALADSDAAETIRYLTGGVLVRVNRGNQQLEPELATSWRVENGGKSIVFQLRPGIFFSDGTPFSAEDVVHTMQVLLDPALHSATGDTFQAGSGTVKTVQRGKYEVAVVFPEPVAGVARLFDQVAILSRNSPLKERAVLGAFRIAEIKSGSYILLARNPNYWKTDHGRRLPYLDGIRLEIQQNRELELLRFRRGQVHLISSLAPDQFQQLAAEDGATVKDAGPTLESEMLWFNMNPSAPIEPYRKVWFGSRNFRLAVSHAIRRDDLCRVVYHGHAQPGIGPFSPANRFWFNQSLKPHSFDLELARRLLADDGFRIPGQSGEQTLRDREGHAVEFSLITNAGNPARERIAAMLQQDLAALGIRLNIVALDFPSLIERISKSSQYESCLLSHVNVDLDPNGQLNVWLSSSATHQWNPNQARPATPWEAEIDRLTRLQSSTLDENRRKPLFDRVQQIVWDEAPLLYLVNRNALVAAARSLHNVQPSVLRPNILWNAERLWIDSVK